MDRVQPGRDPYQVLEACLDDPSLMAISDEHGNVLAVGGSPLKCIWFVHTVHAEKLKGKGRRKMFYMLSKHLSSIKDEAVSACSDDLYHFTNIVSEQNVKHVRLLKALGAVFLPAPVTLNGHKFKQFLF